MLRNDGIFLRTFTISTYDKEVKRMCPDTSHLNITTGLYICGEYLEFSHYIIESNLPICRSNFPLTDGIVVPRVF